MLCVEFKLPQATPPYTQRIIVQIDCYGATIYHYLFLYGRKIISESVVMFAWELKPIPEH